MNMQPRARTTLQTRLDLLQESLGGLQRAHTNHGTPDWGPLDVEQTGDAQRDAHGRSGEREIAMIKAALDRIEAGTYGICTSCGERIEPERLAMLPAAPLCAACAGARRR